jgi:hypothetical protein
MGPDEAVILDSDGNRLRVTEPGSRRTTTATSIVVVESVIMSNYNKRPISARLGSIRRPSLCSSVAAILPVKPA